MKKVIRIVVMAAVVLSVSHILADEAFVDKRPILLIQAKDVRDNRRIKQGGLPAEGLASVAEGFLEELKIYRIITDKAVAGSIQNEEIFKVLNGDNNGGEMKITVPGYRLEMDVTQYDTHLQTSNSSTPFMFKSGKHGKSIATVKSEKTTRTVAVGIVFKIIDIKTQETIFSQKISKSNIQKSKKTSTLGFKTAGKRLDPEDNVLSGTVDELMSDFVEILKDSQTYHVVACSDDGILTVDAPVGVVKKGDAMKVFRQDDAKANKRTGKTFRPETHVATIRVTDSTEESATAEFIYIDDAAVDGDWHVVVRRSRELTEKVAEDERRAAQSSILGKIMQKK